MGRGKMSPSSLCESRNAVDGLLRPLLLCSTFGRKLADVYGCNFIDADEYHPAANVGELHFSISASTSTHSSEIFDQRHATATTPRA